jgi:hypothetical protein
MKKLLVSILILTIAFSISADVLRVSAFSRATVSPVKCMQTTTAYSNYSNSSSNWSPAKQNRRGGSMLDIAKGLVVMTAVYTILGLSVKSR